MLRRTFMYANSPAECPPRKNLLVVDDEPVVLDLLATIFEADGFCCKRAATGEEALRIFREEREHIDALVTDLMMPGMDGMELAAQIRDTEPQMSVLLVSGSMSPPSKELLTAFGNIRFVPKPFTIPTLLESLHELLRAAGAGRRRDGLSLPLESGAAK
jgi:DNA-binding response OmpR family regulator